MAFGVFLHRPDSIYDDVPAERYQFPKQYLSRVQQMVGDWIVYLEPSKVKETRGYFAIAKVQEIIEDSRVPGMYLALIAARSYLDFGASVPFRLEGEVVERGVLNDAGAISGRAQSAVRPLSPADFARIEKLGLGLGEVELAQQGFADAQAPFLQARPEQRVSRKVRDRNFRRVVLRAYGDRCAISGLRLINGGGRAEVEAAHIRPVEENGPDSVRNGIALSRTAHWMFDRGLVGLSRDLEILVSRQTNDPEAMRAMINPTGRLLVPKRPSDRPWHGFVTWHSENRFKA